MKLKSFVLGLSAMALVLLFCSSPSDPYQDRKNTKITSVTVSTPPNGRNSYQVGDTLSVTASLFVAQYIDSVVISLGGYWDTSIVNKGDWTSSQTTTVHHTLDSAGSTIINVAIYVNDGRTLVSAHTPLTVLGTGPAITSDLTSYVVVSEGQQLSLHIGASGTAPLAYCWTKGGDTVRTATTSTLIIAQAVITDSGAYHCIVRNSWGSVTSGVSVVSVSPAGSVPTPSRLSIVGKTASIVTLHWSSVDGIDGYHIHRATVDTFSRSTLVTTVATTYALDSLNLSAATYFYWVTAFRGVHESAASNSVSTADSVSHLVYKPNWLHDTMHVALCEGAQLAVNLRDSCVDSNTSAILAVSIPKDTVLHARISGDTLLTLSAGHRDSAIYFMPVVVSDGVAKDTARVRIVVRATLVTLTKSAVQNGSITISPNQTSWRYGDSAPITAIPNQGYEFDSWLGTIAGKPTPTTITMLTDTTVGARFILIPSCTSLQAGSSINQAIQQASKANPRNTEYCLQPEASYESNTIKSHGKVQISVR